MKIRNFYRYFLVSLILLLGLIWGAVFQLPDNQLHLVFCDVGQGDAALISYKQVQVLVDGGPNNQVLDCLSSHLPFWDRDIEMVVLTHPEADHFTGLIEVIKRYNILQFVVNSENNDSLGFQEFRQLMLAEGVPVYNPKTGDQIKTGPIQLAVLWPKQSAVLGAESGQENLNDTSIVLKLVFAGFTALFTGDISSLVEKQLDLTKVDLLKVAHHGSKYSTGEEFLQAIKPKTAVISVGRNQWGHPTEEVLTRLQSIGAKILRTDENEVEIKI